MYDICPKCAAPTLIFESEYNRYVCLKLECGYTQQEGPKTRPAFKEEPSENPE